MRIFKYVTMVLMSVYQQTELTCKASVSSLHDLVHIIISILLDDQVQKLPDSSQLIRALNILTVKIVERSDHTNIASAFIKLLKVGDVKGSVSKVSIVAHYVCKPRNALATIICPRIIHPW